ncbi:MAG: DNA polymerase thumb domain-containing protein [Phycisphaerales bacterium]
MPLRSLYLDLNSYFAACEQQDDPALRGRPVGVVAVDTDYTSVLAASVEAKRFGIRTGTPVRDAKAMCPELVLMLSRTERYVELHHEIIAAVDTVLPVDKVWSIDEMACRLLGKQQQREEAVKLAHGVKRAIRERVGEVLTCSVGIAPNRLLGKIASDMQKPDGLVVLEDADLPHAMHRLKLTDLPGIGPKMEKRLRAHGITTVEDLCSRSEAELRAAWSSLVGAEWYHRLRGVDIMEKPVIKRSIGHEHVLSPKRRSADGARAVLVRLVHKAAARARQYGYLAGRISVYAKSTEGERWEDSHKLEPPTHDTVALVAAAAEMWSRWPGVRNHRWGAPMKVAATLTDIEPVKSATLPLFAGPRPRVKLGEAMDKVNAKFGRGTIYTASMQEAKTSAPARIAFSNIPDLDDRI